ncbi:MAG: hypothetical protein AB8H86_29840 [Polyangiales bacterium]
MDASREDLADALVDGLHVRVRGLARLRLGILKKSAEAIGEAIDELVAAHAGESVYGYQTTLALHMFGRADAASELSERGNELRKPATELFDAAFGEGDVRSLNKHLEALVEAGYEGAVL